MHTTGRWTRVNGQNIFHCRHKRAVMFRGNTPACFQVRLPHIEEAEKAVEQTVYLHYYTDTADYFISGYDGEETMYGTVKSSVFPDGTEHQKISLANLKKSEFMKLDFSWEGQTPRSGD